MSSAKQNASIARLIVGAMAIDGSLDRKEQQKVAATLDSLGMAELIADVGAAIDEDTGTFNLFDECKKLLTSLGADAAEIAPLVFRVIVDVVASDRFVSAQEAAYLSTVGKRLELDNNIAQKILKQVMADRRGRLEVAGKDIDAQLNKNLKDLLSFNGADKLVGELEKDSLAELMNAHEAMAEGERISHDELHRALAVLGLDGSAKLADAEEVWKETIDNLNLPKMANLGETFVSAAINRITRINNAYKTVLDFYSNTKQSAEEKKVLAA